MREILFRGKRSDNGELVQGSLVHQTQYYGYPADKWFILVGGEFDCDYYDAYEVESDTVEEYTGITDKNGKRIFEGDIVTMPMCPRDGGVINPFGPVVFEDGAFYVKWVENKYEKRHPVGQLNHETAEVIGNIHDNSEILIGDAPCF